MRERYMLRKTADGLTAPEIAVRAACARATVDTHLEHIRRKLAARTRAHAVAIALRRGLIE